MENNLFRRNEEIGDEQVLQRNDLISAEESDFENDSIEGDEESLEELTALKDRAKLCYVCDDSKIDFFYDCGKGLCNECLIEHLKAQIVKYKTRVLSKEIKFVCASSCKCPVKSELMEKMMDKPTQDLYHEVLFKMYLSKSQDIVSCPKSDCPGSGFIPKFGNNLFCRVAGFYECPECKYKWSDNSINFKNMIFSSGFLTKVSLTNVKSVIKKFLITKYCNNCSAPIEKAEGCKHMECNRCEYSFCWNCTGNWEGHLEKSCMGMLTNEYDETFRISCAPQFLTVICVLLILKIIFSFWFIMWFLWFLGKAAFFVGLIVYDLFFAYGIFHIYCNHPRKILTLFPISILITSDCLFYYFRIHPFSQKLYFICEVISMFTFLVVTLVKRSRRRMIE